MENKPKTYVAIVLDKSGSMYGTKTQAINGYNEQVQQYKKYAQDGQEIFVSLITFNGEVFEHHWNESAEVISEANESEFVPSGNTAMRDAIGYTIQKLQETTDQNDPNNAYLVIIISDGETNADKKYSVDSLREMIDACQKSGKWTFTYMGCSESYLKKISSETGVSLSNMATWSNNTAAEADYAMKCSNARTESYFSSRATGVIRNMNFYNDNDNCVANFTDTPSSSPTNQIDPFSILKNINPVDFPEKQESKAFGNGKLVEKK